MNDKKGTIRIEAWRNISQESFTKFEVENTKENSEVAELMLIAIQRIISEWLQGGMEEKHCYNLVMLAVRKAKTELQLKESNNEK